ncbi:GnsA/GnsB family addiction module toxin, partial [Escherichia coli]
MNIENLKTKAEADISEYITKKIIAIKNKAGNRVCGSEGGWGGMW